MAITKEQVFDAADLLSRAGTDPTYLNVRSQLGSGSFSTIQKYLRLWKESRGETSPSTQEYDVPEHVFTTARNFAKEIWRVSNGAFAGKVAALRDELEQQYASAIADSQTASQLVDVLQERAQDAAESARAARAEVEDLRTTLLTVERDRASRESAIENLTRALDRKETDLERCTVTLTEREALIERLTVELKSSVEECSQRDRTILNLNAQLEIRATQLQDARDRSQSLSQELEATRREVATGFEQLALERQRYETLADQFSALTQRLAESPAAHTGALGKAANS
jgi:hypothetical protein